MADDRSRATVALHAQRPQFGFRPICLASRLPGRLPSLHNADFRAHESGTQNDFALLGAHLSEYSGLFVPVQCR